MKLIIDFHAHIFRDPFSGFKSADRVSQLRRRARNWAKPIAWSMHKTQPILRHLPDRIRHGLDELGALTTLPQMVLESTPADLEEAMQDSGVNYAVVIAQPPVAPSEFILEACAANPKLIPAVNVPSGTPRPGQKLKKLVDLGAKLLKIHPSIDGEGPDSPRYQALIKTASDCGLPVILHTGCMHSTLFYKNPKMGQAQMYAPWFKEYPNTQFILAHMNFHEPNIALDLAEEHANVHVDTSWQPAEVIGEAARRIGAERVLFATDWPFLGNNLAVGTRRVQDSVDAGMLRPEDAELILGRNAAKLLGIPNAPQT